jgi:hypothetical protein
MWPAFRLFRLTAAREKSRVDRGFSHVSLITTQSLLRCFIMGEESAHVPLRPSNYEINPRSPLIRRISLHGLHPECPPGHPHCCTCGNTRCCTSRCFTPISGYPPCSYTRTSGNTRTNGSRACRSCFTTSSSPRPRHTCSSSSTSQRGSQAWRGHQVEIGRYPSGHEIR